MDVVGVRRSVAIVACAVTLGACATGLLQSDDTNDEGGAGDATTKTDATPSNDASAPTADGACASPTTKCASDAGAVCVNELTDPNHCGGCTNACAAGDAGSLPVGPNNPDAGVAFDSGIGWMLGTPACDAGACAVSCASGFTDCSGICFDTNNDHDHCGACSTACTSTQWCNGGSCCALGQEFCNGSCTDVLSNASSCGACGNVCPAQTPTCSNGTCVAGVTFSQQFTYNLVASSQCTAWQSFTASLTGTYTSVTLSGSNDTTGRTCTGATANTLCQAIHNNTSVAAVSCNGHTWAVGTCGDGNELSADGTICACETPGYTVRPCIGTDQNWGGIATQTCTSATQTITVTCQ